jgi:hypothetical protein
MVTFRCCSGAGFVHGDHGLNQETGRRQLRRRLGEGALRELRISMRQSRHRPIDVTLARLVKLVDPTPAFTLVLAVRTWAQEFISRMFENHLYRAPSSPVDHCRLCETLRGVQSKSVSTALLDTLEAVIQRPAGGAVISLAVPTYREVLFLG